MRNRKDKILPESKHTGSVKHFVSRYQMLWRMLLTVAMLICVPMFLVNWFTLRNIYEKTEQQNREIQRKNTIQFANYFISQQNDMRRLTYDIRYDPTLQPDTLKDQKYNVLVAIERIKYYRRAVTCAGDMYVYYRDGDFVLSADNEFRREFFANSFTLDYRNYTELDEVLFSDKDSISYLGITNPRSNFCDGMLVCIPSRMKNRNDSVVMFHITSISLNEAYFGQTVDESAEMLIFDGDKLLLSNAGKSRFAESEEFMALITGDEDGGDVRCGGDYVVTKVNDSVTGLCFVIVSPLEIVAGTENGARGVVNMLMIVSVVIMILLASLTVYINYRPIVTALKRIPPLNEERLEKGELTAIMDTLDDVMNRNEVMSRTISERNVMLEDFVVQRLLAGKNVFDRDLEVVRMPRREGCFFIITIITEMSAALTAEIREQLLTSLEEG